MAVHEHLTYAAYRTAERVAGSLPPAAVPAVARAAGVFGPRVLPARRRLVARHLGRVYGPGVAEGRIREATRELEQLIRRAPEQRHLMQPNWPSDPGRRTRQ